MTQATKDAMADAETLRLYYACAGFPPSLLPEYGYHGELIDARLLAHAAFRAVPELRS